MQRIAVGAVLCTLVLLGLFPLVAWGDVITPAMEERNYHKAKLIKSILKAKSDGALKRQLKKAQELDRFCSRSYMTYSAECLHAKMTLADVYWANNQLNNAKKTLAPYCAGFERSYKEGLKKIARYREQEKKKTGSTVDKIVSSINVADQFFEMDFYKAGPGAVPAQSRFDMLVYLGDLCKALGQKSEASMYIKKAESLRTEYNKSHDYGRFQSFAKELENSRVRQHPMWAKALSK